MNATSFRNAPLPSPAAAVLPFPAPPPAAAVLPFPAPPPAPPSSEELSNRSIYLGGIDPNTTSEEILSHVHCGLIDSVKILPEKGCAFISFIDPTSAQAFYQETSIGRFLIRDRELKVGWGKPKPLPQEVLHYVENGATRNVFIGGIDDTMHEDFFRKEFERFGEVEHVRVIHEKKVAFVHFTSLNAALKCVSTIPKESGFSRCKVNFGKDRCNRRSPFPFEVPAMNGLGSIGGAPLPIPGSVPPTMLGSTNGVGFNGYTPDRRPIPQQPAAPLDPSRTPPRAIQSNPVHRTVYIGGIDASTTAEELCEYIRGGLLDNVKVMPEKNCAFVTFIFPEGAQLFYEYASQQGLLIKGRQVKVGWGKPSSIPPEIVSAVNRGATRNVYIGNIDEGINEQQLHDELSSFGFIESISIVPDKRCAFVSFTSIVSALRAVNNLSINHRFQNHRVNFGKDVCARLPPRSGSFPSNTPPSPSRVPAYGFPSQTSQPPSPAYPPPIHQETLAPPNGMYGFPNGDHFQTSFGYPFERPFLPK